MNPAVAAIMARQRSAAAAAAASQGGIEMSVAEEVLRSGHIYQLKISYEVVDCELKAVKSESFLGLKTTHTSIGEAIKEKLPMGAKVVSLVVDWDNSLVRVFYTK